MGELRYSSKILVVKPEGKGPFEKPKRRQENNIRMELAEILV
jgi:hypothetical protein